MMVCKCGSTEVGDNYRGNEQYYMCEECGNKWEPVKEVLGWQDISTAPRDGTEILLLMPLRWGDESKSPKDSRIGAGDYIKSGWRDGNHWIDRVNFYADNATHWMPLPNPPVTE